MPNQNVEFGIQEHLCVKIAGHTRGTEQNEVWGVDATTAELLWQHNLQAENLFAETPIDDRWSYYLTNDGLILIQLLADNDPPQLLTQKVAINDGQLIYETSETMNVQAGSWRGLTWSPNYAYLSAQALYELDLSDGSLTAVWP